MTSIPGLFTFAALLLDAAVLPLSFAAAYWLRFRSGFFSVQDFPVWTDYAWSLWGLVPLYFLVFKYTGLYRMRRGISGTDELSRALRAAAVAGVLSAAATFLVKQVELSRLVVGITALLAAIGAWAARRLLRQLQVLLHRGGFLAPTRLLVVGAGDSARSLLRRIKANPALGYQLMGVVADAPGAGDVEGEKVVGTLDDFSAVLERTQVEEVLFALPAAAHARLLPLLVEIQDTPVKYRIVSDLFGLITNPVEVDELSGVPIFEMKEAPLSAWHNRAIKRTFDVALSAAALLILSPVLAAVALGVKLSSPGPVLFKQKRVGRDGRVFTMYKFRSMKAGSETAAFTQADDPRRTAFGIFIRKTSLDELPQFYNVLQGRMSLVGPRPEVPALVREFEQTVPRYFERHQVKAGITGWAQVHGLRGNTSIEERVRHDIYYIENWSPWLDLRILVRTALDILEHDHAY